MVPGFANYCGCPPTPPKIHNHNNISIYFMSCNVPLNYITGVFSSFYYCLITISSSKPQFSLQNAPKQSGGRDLIFGTLQGASRNERKEAEDRREAMRTDTHNF